MRPVFDVSLRAGSIPRVPANYPLCSADPARPATAPGLRAPHRAARGLTQHRPRATDHRLARPPLRARRPSFASSRRGPTPGPTPVPTEFSYSFVYDTLAPVHKSNFASRLRHCRITASAPDSLVDLHTGSRRRASRRPDRRPSLRLGHRPDRRQCQCVNQTAADSPRLLAKHNAIDATRARRRGVAVGYRSLRSGTARCGLEPLAPASTAAFSPRGDLVQNSRAPGRLTD